MLRGISPFLNAAQGLISILVVPQNLILVNASRFEQIALANGQ